MTDPKLARDAAGGDSGYVEHPGGGVERHRQLGAHATAFRHAIAANPVAHRISGAGRRSTVNVT